MDHHLVLILAEMLDRVALNGVAIKGWNHEFSGNKSQYAYGEGVLDASVTTSLSLPRCDNLASSTRFCTNLLRY